MKCVYASRSYSYPLILYSGLQIDIFSAWRVQNWDHARTYTQDWKNRLVLRDIHTQHIIIGMTFLRKLPTELDVLIITGVYFIRNCLKIRNLNI